MGDNRKSGLMSVETVVNSAGVVNYPTKDVALTLVSSYEERKTLWVGNHGSKVVLVLLRAAAVSNDFDSGIVLGEGQSVKVVEDGEYTGEVSIISEDRNFNVGFTEI